MYSDNNFKFVAILNKKIELPKLLNALAHISVGLTSLLSKNAVEFLNYLDKDGTNHPAISKYPFIILSSENSNQIRSLRKSAIELGIVYNDFTESMLGTSSEDQMEKTKELTEPELTYFAICIFGSAFQIDPITKKFSVFKTIGIPPIESSKKLMFH